MKLFVTIIFLATVILSPVLAVSVDVDECRREKGISIKLPQACAAKGYETNTAFKDEVTIIEAYVSQHGIYINSSLDELCGKTGYKLKEPPVPLRPILPGDSEEAGGAGANEVGLGGVFNSVSEPDKKNTKEHSTTNNETPSSSEQKTSDKVDRADTNAALLILLCVLVSIGLVVFVGKFIYDKRHQN